MITIGTITFTGRISSLITPREGELQLHPPQDGCELERHSAFHHRPDSPVTLARVHFPRSVQPCKKTSLFKGRSKEGRRIEGRRKGIIKIHICIYVCMGSTLWCVAGKAAVCWHPIEELVGVLPALLPLPAPC